MSVTPSDQNRDSTKRFGDRVDDYVKYRPTYPQEIVKFMISELGFTQSRIVVDVGSGTGISSELFLKNGNTVYGVEPNDPMRVAAEEGLKQYPDFRSLKGTSESTGLPDQIADFIVAAQAFHWFDPKASKLEFKRILKPDGWVCLIWNGRRTTGSDFSVAYEKLINDFGTDYMKVKHQNIEETRINEFLGQHQVRQFYNFQELNFDGLLGRLTSSSYAPNIGHARYEEMRKSLKTLFDQFNFNGSVKIEYDTKIYYSKMHEVSSDSDRFRC